MNANNNKHTTYEQTLPTMILTKINTLMNNDNTTYDNTLPTTNYELTQHNSGSLFAGLSL